MVLAMKKLLTTVACSATDDFKAAIEDCNEDELLEKYADVLHETGYYDQIREMFECLRQAEDLNRRVQGIGLYQLDDVNPCAMLKQAINDFFDIDGDFYDNLCSISSEVVV